MFKNRGYTDKLYFMNFIAVHIIVGSVVLLTALSGYLKITDMSALSVIPQYAYMELGVHTGFVIWKAQRENIRKFNAHIHKKKEEDEDELVS